MPVEVKVKRLQGKMDVEKSQKSHRSNVQQFQPTLRTFIDLRSGLVGPKCGKGTTKPSETKSRAETGQGPRPGTDIVDTWGHGEIEKMRMVTGGSPETLLLKEAGSLGPREHRSQGRKKAREQAKGEPEGRESQVSPKGRRNQDREYDIWLRKDPTLKEEISPSGPVES